MSRAPWRPRWWRDPELIAVALVSVAVVGLLGLYGVYLVSSCDCG